MTNIIFVQYPETGHLNPSFEFAKALQSHGHRVYYLALPDYREYVQQQGFDFIPIFERLCPPGFIQQYAVEKNLDNLQAVFLRAKETGQMPDLFKEIQDVVRRIKPELFLIDLMLRDFALVAEQAGARIILLNLQFFNPWVEEKVSYAPLLKWPELIACPQEFDFPGTERKKNSLYVEASIDVTRKDMTVFPWERLDERKRLVYCAFGSQSHIFKEASGFFQSVVDAVAQRPDWQLVLAITNWQPRDFPSIPSNVILVERAPQLEILKRATLMVSHGGFNTVKESIYFDVPMILFPMLRDHPAIAARVAYHGLGIRAELHRASVEQINALIDQLDHDPSFRERVKAMGETFRKAEEAARGVQIILKTLELLRMKPDKGDISSLMSSVIEDSHP